ncbi:MAG: hypothetical protein ACHQE5_01810 [Actinomycetes bacterium]
MTTSDPAAQSSSTTAAQPSAPDAGTDAKPALTFRQKIMKIFQPDNESELPVELKRLVRNTALLFTVWFIANLLIIFLYCLPLSGWPELLGALGAGLMASGAALASGALVGLLFGVPRSAGVDHKSASPSGYLANTNLEVIADWLTKIIVGVGLVQFKAIAAAVVAVSAALAASFRDNPNSGTTVFGASLLLAAFLVGFLYIYLLARTVLPFWLEAAGRADKKKKKQAAKSRGDLVT